MQSFARDLRFGFRNLIKTPGFTAIVVLTLALGIGANTAIFSIVHGVLLKPLDFEKPEQLLSLWEYAPDDAGRMNKSRATSRITSTGRRRARCSRTWPFSARPGSVDGRR